MTNVFVYTERVPPEDVLRAFRMAASQFDLDYDFPLRSPNDTEDLLRAADKHGVDLLVRNKTTHTSNAKASLRRYDFDDIAVKQSTAYINDESTYLKNWNGKAYTDAEYWIPIIQLYEDL